MEHELSSKKNGTLTKLKMKWWTKLTKFFLQFKCCMFSWSLYSSFLLQITQMKHMILLAFTIQCLTKGEWDQETWGITPPLKLLFLSLSNLYMPTWICSKKNHNSSCFSGWPSPLDSALDLLPLAGFSESPVCSFCEGSSEDESAFSFCPLFSVPFVVGFSTFGFGLGILLTLAT